MSVNMIQRCQVDGIDYWRLRGEGGEMICDWMEGVPPKTHKEILNAAWAADVRQRHLPAVRERMAGAWAIVHGPKVERLRIGDFLLGCGVGMAFTILTMLMTGAFK